MDKTEQLERTLDKESITFKELKEGILKYKAKSEYQQAAIIIIRGVLEKRLNERGGSNNHIVNISICTCKEPRQVAAFEGKFICCNCNKPIAN